MLLLCFSRTTLRFLLEAFLDVVPVDGHCVSLVECRRLGQDTLTGPVSFSIASATSSNSASRPSTISDDMSVMPTCRMTRAFYLVNTCYVACKRNSSEAYQLFLDGADKSSDKYELVTVPTYTSSRSLRKETIILCRTSSTWSPVPR